MMDDGRRRKLLNAVWYERCGAVRCGSKRKGRPLVRVMMLYKNNNATIMQYSASQVQMQRPKVLDHGTSSRQRAGASSIKRAAIQ